MLAALLLFPAGSVSAQLSVSALIQSGMVVQRQTAIPLSGHAAEGVKVYFELNGYSDSVTTTSNGQWDMSLPAMEAGGPYELNISSGGSALQFTDLYAGDVWLASGQSNMAFELKNCDNAAAEIAAANSEEIRQLLIKKTLGSTPAEEIPAGSTWRPATSDYAGDFSGVAYYFAKYLHDSLDIPIGIINSSYGGTSIQAWMSEQTLGFDEQDIVLGDGSIWHQPTVAYNKMLNPLQDIPLKGVIWYQGESNMGNRETALSYSGLQTNLIASWRQHFSKENLPFIWVQLPNIGVEANESTPATWDALPMLRASQSRVMATPYTGEVVSIDLGEVDVHPPNKKPVGQRLASVARVVVYGEDIPYSGPRYKNHRTREDGKLEIEFDHVGGGLVARETGDQSLRWFALAGSNGAFHQATAVIENDKVLVWSNSVANPVTIRYAWEHNPHNVNFFNTDSLPAAPFKVEVRGRDYGLNFLKATDYQINKGASTILTWEVNKAEMVELDGIMVDTIGGLRVWPPGDSTFTLSFRSRSEPYTYDQATIHIDVIEPEPNITLVSDAGEVIPVGSEVNILARVSAPNGGTITLVRFYVNDILIDSITTAPFESSWIPDSAGVYDIYGIVSNQLGMTTESEHLLMNVDDLMEVIFEAEDAVHFGDVWVQDEVESSGGRFAELTGYWTITFDSIEVKKDSVYQVTVVHRLNYGSPKTQDMQVNSGSKSSVIFQAAYTDAWTKTYLMVPLVAGNNAIKWIANWGYMSLDYISVAMPVEEVDTSTTNLPILLPVSWNIYPNPVSNQASIKYTLPEEGHLKIDLLDLSGRSVQSYPEHFQEAGTHRKEIDVSGMKSGIYLLRLNFHERSIMKKMIVL